MDQQLIDEFRDQGFLAMGPLLGDADLRYLTDALEGLAASPDSDAFEPDAVTLRAKHGQHLTSGAFADLTRLPVLVEAARAVLSSDVYVYQFKINYKQAFYGEKWPWHDDFVFWNIEDGLPSSDVVTIAIFIDDVTEFNGPLFVIPRSHAEKNRSIRSAGQDPNDPWRSHVSSDLRYQADPEQVRRLAERHGMRSVKGPAGSALLFHSNLLHASSANVSPMSRRTILITYCKVGNVPTKLQRPEFLVARQFSAVQALDRTFLQPAAL